MGHARSTAALGSWLPAQPPAPRETESAEHRPPWSPATRGSRGAWRRPGVHGSRHGALPAHRPAHSAPARHAHRGQPRPLSLHLLQTRDSSRTGPVHMRAGVSWLGGRMGADLKGDLCLRTGGWTLPEKGNLYLRRGVGLRTGAGAWARGGGGDAPSAQASALSPSATPSPSSPHAHQGQVVTGPGPPAAPVRPQLLQRPHGSHLGFDLRHVRRGDVLYQLPRPPPGEGQALSWALCSPHLPHLWSCAPEHTLKPCHAPSPTGEGQARQPGTGCPPLSTLADPRPSPWKTIPPSKPSSEAVSPPPSSAHWGPLQACAPPNAQQGAGDSRGLCH